MEPKLNAQYVEEILARGQAIKSWLTSQFQENVDSVARKVNCLSLWRLSDSGAVFRESLQPCIENLNVLECPRCGLVYLNSDPVPYYRSVKRNTS